MLAGKTVCIIGGSSGIGLSVARLAADLGARIIIGSRSQEKVDAAVRSVPGSTGSAVDVTGDAPVEAFFGPISALDHLVVSVSASSPGPVMEGPLPPFERAFATKFWGACRAVRAAAGRMRPGGSIVLVSGITSRKPVAGMTNLTPLNAAVEALVRALALELAPLRVNGISPGLVDTPYWEQRLDGAAKAALFQSAAASLPAGRAGLPGDCAQAVLYLLSAGWVTGTVLDVEGGFLLGSKGKESK